MSVQLSRRLFSVEEYYQMAEAGILTEDDRVELIEGEIIQMSPLGPRHAACVGRLNRLFNQRVADLAIVRVQDPIRLGKRSELQPDVALVQPRPDFYARAHPEPEDVLLLVEVAETSAANDRDVKIPLYARAVTPEVWLVYLMGQSVEVYRKPSQAGYQEVRQLRRGESLSPLALPALTLTADMVLG